jgi:hypothetical protein
VFVSAAASFSLESYDKNHDHVMQLNHTDYSAQALFDDGQAWLVSLPFSISDETIEVILHSPESKAIRGDCHVSHITRVDSRTTLEIVCVTFTDTVPDFVFFVDRILSEFGEVIIEENQLFMHKEFATRATQTNAPWSLDRIDERKRPIDGYYRYDYTGNGVEIFILDTGVRTSHVEFGGRARNVFNAATRHIDTRSNTDCHGHGTMVASVAAGATYGSAKGASIVGVVTLDCNGHATTNMIATAMSYVQQYAKENPTKRIVVNLSFGGQFSRTINSHTTAMASLPNVIVTVAAGNESVDACGRSPAGAKGVMTVGATDAWDNLARFTNNGVCINITAPGVQILGASHLSDTGRVLMSGTSFSSPYTAGVVALTYQQASFANAVEDVKEAVYNWATLFTFSHQVLAAENYDPRYSGIDYGFDIRDDPIVDEAIYNHPFLYSRVNLNQKPPNRNVDRDVRLYPPSNSTRAIDTMNSLFILILSVAVFNLL